MRKPLVSAVLCIALVLALFPLAASAAADFNSYIPYDLTAELIDPDEMHPYGSVLLNFRINNLPRSDSDNYWYVIVEKKIGDNPWAGVLELESGQCLDYYQKGTGKFEMEQLWNEDYNWDGTAPISFRVQVVLYDYTFS